MESTPATIGKVKGAHAAQLLGARHELTVPDERHAALQVYELPELQVREVRVDQRPVDLLAWAQHGAEVARQVVAGAQL
jgi:hypothetical protein